MDNESVERFFKNLDKLLEQSKNESRIIEELKKRNVELEAWAQGEQALGREKALGWISLAEELPPKDEICILKKDGIFSEIRDRKIFVGFWDGVMFKEVSCHCIAGKDGNVTHWMPLPEA